MTVHKLATRSKKKPAGKAARKTRKKLTRPRKPRLTRHRAALQMVQKQKRAIVSSLARGADRLSASGAAGISRTTLYRWFRDDPAFLQRCVAAERKCITTIEAVNFREAKRNFADRKLYLESRAGYKTRVDLGLEDEPQPSQDDGRPDLQTMDQDDLDDYIAKLTAASKRRA